MHALYPIRWTLRGCQWLVIGVLMSSAVTLAAQETSPTTDEVIAAVTAATQPDVIQQMTSPDGAQSAEVIMYPCTALEMLDGERVSYEQIELVDSATGDRQTLAEQVIYCGGLGAAGLAIRHWSFSGDFLYYTDAREGTPDGMAFNWTPPLWRVHLPDGDAESLGQATFSPDREWVAAWQSGELRLLMTDDDEAMTFEHTPDDLQITTVVWLPDSSGVLYVQADDPYGDASRTTVTHVDLDTMTQTVLLDRRE